MRHGVKKIKFNSGIDANQALMKKLVYNFLMHGKITTTEAKIKSLKSLMDIVLHKLHENTPSNKNYLLRYIHDTDLIDTLYRDVSPLLKDRVGGYVRSTRLYQRSSDGVLIMRLEWVDPVVVDFKKDQQKVSASKTKAKKDISTEEVKTEKS